MTDSPAGSPGSRGAPRALAPARHPAAWLLALLLCVAGVIGLHRVFVVSSEGQVAEYMALQSATDRMTSSGGASAGAWEDALRTVLGVLPEVVGTVAVLAFLALTVWRRRWLASLIAAGAFLGANVTTQLLKDALVRPDLPNGVPYYTGNSLPSGHTTFAAAAMVAVLLLVGPRLRPFVAAVGAVFATAVGGATFVETWHRPSDMAAAYLVAAAWGLVGGFLVMRTGTEWNTLRPRIAGRRPRAPGGVIELLLVLAGTGLTVAAVLLALSAGLPEPPVERPVDTSAGHFLAGLLLSVGPGLAGAGLLSAFLRWQAGRDPSTPRR